MLRIRKTGWKFVYIVVGEGLILAIGFLILRGLPQPIPPIVGNLLTLAFYFVATRSFRGQGEPIEPPRVWWRVTSKPKAGFVLGSFLAFSLIVSVIQELVKPDASFAFNVGGLLVSAFLAVVYFNSSIRLVQNPPETVAEPEPLEKFKPIKY